MRSVNVFSDFTIILLASVLLRKHFRHRFFDDIDGFFNVSGIDIERWQEAEDIIVGTYCDKSVLNTFRGERLGIDFHD